MAVLFYYSRMLVQTLAAVFKKRVSIVDVLFLDF